MNKVVFIKNGLVKYEDYKETLDQLEDKVRDCKLKDKEIERLNNIINELEKYLYEHSQVDFDCNDNIVHEQLALSMAYEYLKKLKEDNMI